MFKAENYSLAKLNAFQFNHSACRYVECQNDAELLEFSKDWRSKQGSDSVPVVLGEGSNTVLTRDIDGPVLRFTGTDVSLESGNSDSSVLVHAQAGKNWHELVLEMIDNGLAGIENLSLIPGTCGAAPVQNIGAYGVELHNTLIKLTAFHWPSQQTLVMSREQCQFGYRDSVFKRHPGEYIISEITLELSTNNNINTSYTALQDMLCQRQIDNPQPKDISDIVCTIRRSKLPDPATLANAGSFFKNPVVTNEKFQALRQQYPELPAYSTNTPEKVKIAAGWLIDTAGLKGYEHPSRHVAVHDKQALVLVHRGGGTSAELMELAHHVQTTIENTFGVLLEREPRLL